MNHFSHNSVIDPSCRFGDGVSVWNFTVIMAGVAVGDDVSIGSLCEIGRGSIIGKGTRIGNGVFIPPNTMIGENVFIAPHVCMCDDKNPRVKNLWYTANPPVIYDNVSIGAGCVILPGVTIYSGARIGAGSVVSRDVPSNSLVYGERAIEREPKEFR